LYKQIPDEQERKKLLIGFLPDYGKFDKMAEYQKSERMMVDLEESKIGG
jgi:hypothetical protein